MIKTITVFGSSDVKENSGEWKTAYELGREHQKLKIRRSGKKLVVESWKKRR